MTDKDKFAAVIAIMGIIGTTLNFLTAAKVRSDERAREEKNPTTMWYMVCGVGMWLFWLILATAGWILCYLELI